MSAYRDRELSCPACKATLRAFLDRFVCDACSGLQLGLSDLKRSVEDLACAACELVWHGDNAGRTCPQCPAKMIAAKLEIHFDDEHLRSARAYERCPQHGAWFDGEELAQVFLLVERRVNRGTAMAARPNPRDNNLHRLSEGLPWERTKK